jgi:hypothetical protein
MLIPDGAVREAVEIEVGGELGVETQQQVLVERGRHTEWIVVGEQQLALGLDEVRSEQQPVTGDDGAADEMQERRGARGIEIADVRSQERDEPAVSCRPCRQLREPRLVPRLTAGRVNAELVQRLAGTLERPGGHVDQAYVEHRPFESSNERDELLAVSAAKLHNMCGRGLPAHVIAVSGEKSQLRLGDAIPREQTDGLKEAGTEGVVQPPGRQLARLETEVVADLVFDRGWRRDRRDRERLIVELPKFLWHNPSVVSDFSRTLRVLKPVLKVS